MRTRVASLPLLLVALIVCLPRPSTSSQDDTPCQGDFNGDGRVTIDELVRAVNHALYGCAPPSATPTPSLTQAPSATPSHTATATATATCGLQCPDDMVAVGSEFCMDRYEASRPDATIANAGATESVATSRPGVLPWMVNPMSRAHLLRFQDACQAAGKQLCTGTQWLAACRGPAPGTSYVFGNTFNRETCNCVDTFCDDYCNDHGILPASCNTGTNCGYTYNCFHAVPTGTFPQCTNAYGTFDINGNVWEIVPSDTDPRGYEVRGGAYNCASAALRLQCTFNAGWDDLYAGFRCCYAP
jgi:hypothetical protein